VACAIEIAKRVAAAEAMHVRRFATKSRSPYVALGSYACAGGGSELRCLLLLRNGVALSATRPTLHRTQLPFG
jgi:hypothetical protein